MGNKEEIQRNFVLGGDWLYYKIYTGTKTSDVILTQGIQPLAENLVKEKIIKSWFFIRYTDPDYHLRIRFCFVDTDNIIIVIKQLHDLLKQYFEKDLIFKIQTDTYNREIERYGKNTMVHSEDLFYYDSEMVTSFLSLIEGDEGEQLRWIFGLRAIDELFNDFDYSLSDKYRNMERLKDRFGKEFGMSRILKKQLDNKFRQNRAKIVEFLELQREKLSEYKPVIDVLHEKSNRVAPICSQILELREKGELQLPLDNLMGSYIHMLMNRLFRSKNRLHEMVCYDFLYRIYRSKLARMKK